MPRKSRRQRPSHSILLTNTLSSTSTAPQLHMILDDVISATDPDEIDQIISNWDIDDQQLEEEEYTSSVPQVNLTSTSLLLDVDVTSTLPLSEVNNNNS